MLRKPEMLKVVNLVVTLCLMPMSLKINITIFYLYFFCYITTNTSDWLFTTITGVRTMVSYSV